MKLIFAQLILIVFNLTPLIVDSTSISSNPIFGISPEDESYYGGGSNLIDCRDGSKKINRSQLNDDFCDCVDGSDEPGTSACPNGKFYCRNAGHMPLVLFSSRVNDGICDCCDGSDEYDGRVTCPNTCWEAGKAARDKLMKKIATYEEGVIIRKKEIEQAKLAFAKDEAELSKLKGEEKILKGLVQQLQDRKEQIEKQEEKERLEKEKEEKLRQEAEKESDQDKTEDEKNAESVIEEHSDTAIDDVVGNVKDFTEQDIEEEVLATVTGDQSKAELSTSNTAEPHVRPEEENNELSDTAESASDLEKKHDIPASENTEGLSKEELGRLVASRWTGEKADHESVGADDVKDTDGEETPKDLHDENYDGYASEVDADDNKYDDNDSFDHKYDTDDDPLNDDLTAEDHVDSSSYKSDSEDESDITESGNPSWLEKIQRTVKNILQGFTLFQTPLNTTDAAVVRKEYDESNAKLSKIQSRISTLSEKLKLDAGPEKEFYSFYDRCFESKQNKYVYKVCPFKKASQEEGHMTTRLGRWEKFEDSYKVMLFSNGDRCWNGPDRSMRVKLRCGLKNEVTDVDEPSRCEYVALLSTPSVCREEKLLELKQKLDALNNQQPLNHDEL